MKSNIAMCYVYKLYAVVAFIVPLAILVGFNWDMYVSVPSTGITFFGFIIIIMIIFAVKNKLLGFMKDNMMLSVSIGLFVVSAIMHYMADQLMLISAVSCGSSLICEVFDRVATVYQRNAYDVNSQGQIPTNNIVLSQRNAWRLAYGQPIQQ